MIRGRDATLDAASAADDSRLWPCGNDRRLRRDQNARRMILMVSSSQFAANMTNLGGRSRQHGVSSREARVRH